jgi:hypothetical protein
MSAHNNMSLLELARPVAAIMPISKAASAVASGAWISLKNVNKLGIMVMVGAGAGTFNVTLQQATAVAGTGAKALAFTKAVVNSSAIAADSFTRTTVVANSLPLTANDVALIDIDPADLDINNDFDCVQVVVTESGGASAQLVSAHYIVKSGKVESLDAAPSHILD